GSYSGSGNVSSNSIIGPVSLPSLRTQLSYQNKIGTKSLLNGVFNTASPVPEQKTDKVNSSPIISLVTDRSSDSEFDHKNDSKNEKANLIINKYLSDNQSKTGENPKAEPLGIKTNLYNYERAKMDDNCTEKPTMANLETSYTP
ncbi:MAG: hypothetical protein MHPSP_004485, partial [Paramarteilia canceri]